MYKYQSTQISISDFNMPLGLPLDPNNRWIKKAQIVPWGKIEQRYASLFAGKIKGNVAYPLRLALGALLIQMERDISDEEVVLQIQESPYLQYFCGFPGYTFEKPFDSTSMVHFRRRLSADVMREVNEIVIAAGIEAIENAKRKNENVKNAGKKSKGDDDDTPTNGAVTTGVVKENTDGSKLPNVGTLIVDATCAPQHIRYPQDLSLLNEAREKLEAMIDELHNPADGIKPRTYREEARREYLSIAKRKKKSMKVLRKAIRKQLCYIVRDLKIIDRYLAMDRKLSDKWVVLLPVIRKLYEQQLYMYQNKVNRVDDRIVSLSQHWVRPIVRGKANAKCEFGAKFEISVVDGLARVERISFDAYNESTELKNTIEQYYARNGRYPQKILADQIYRTKDNRKYCKERNIILSGKPLGRPPKDDASYDKQCRQDEIDRGEVERMFGYAKGSFGLKRVWTRLKETTGSAITVAIFAMNIANILRDVFALFGRWLFGRLSVTHRQSGLDRYSIFFYTETNIAFVR